MFAKLLPAALVAALLSAASADPAPAAETPSGFLAGEWDVAGSAGLEMRGFLFDPAFADQDDIRLSPSVFIEPDIAYEWSGGDDRLTFVPFLRLDADDPNRTHVDIREANWFHRADEWDMRVGAAKVFWGVTESVHLVDIINQTDAVENVDGEDKLGQPMVNLNLERDWGVVSLFLMPYFRERTFAGSEARLRGSKPVRGEATYDSDMEEWAPDVAFRWSHVIGDMDIGLAHFHGTSREATAVDTGDSFRPHYDRIDQTSVDAQLTQDAWLWKLEAMTRSGHGDRIYAAVGGFEYTLFGIAETQSDLGLILEYAHDSRDASAPATAADNDIFLGARWAANDEHDTEILAGTTIDRLTQETLVFIEAERRFGDVWKGEAELRLSFNPADAGIVAGVADDDHLILRATRFF